MDSEKYSRLFPTRNPPKGIFKCKSSVLTYSEARLYRIMKNLIRSSIDPILGNAVVFPKVVLYEIIDHTEDEDFNRISSKSVDFLLCDCRTLKPFIAIELDGKSHDSDERKERDASKDFYLNSAGIPVARIKIDPKKTEFDSSEIRKIIVDTIMAGVPKNVTYPDFESLMFDENCCDSFESAGIDWEDVQIEGAKRNAYHIAQMLKEINPIMYEHVQLWCELAKVELQLITSERKVFRNSMQRELECVKKKNDLLREELVKMRAELANSGKSDTQT